MNSFSTFILICLLAVSFNTASYAESKTSLYIPPTSLEKWYKPANKRQVWLHTMFRLRREMQAISEYSQMNDLAATTKWIGRLEKDYNEITEMVPEWKNEVKPRLLSELKMFVDRGDTYRISKTLEMIQRTCDDCHSNYQPQVTAIYRSPHYDDIQIKDSNGVNKSFEDNMEDLSVSVNNILIALDDGHKLMALKARQNLVDQLRNLGSSCSTCHIKDNYPRERILGKNTQSYLESLKTSINEGRVKDSQKLMGEFAVTVCARCHNTHRIIHDLRNAILPAE